MFFWACLYFSFTLNDNCTEHKILCSCLVFCFPLSILNISLFSLVAHMNSEERSVVILIFVPLQVSFPPTSYRKFSLVLIFCSLKMMPRCWPSSCLMFSELSGPVIEYVTLICGRFCYYCIKYVLLFLYLSSISFWHCYYLYTILWIYLCSCPVVLSS